MKNESLPQSSQPSNFLKITIGMGIGLSIILLIVSGIELWANQKGLDTKTLKSAMTTIMLFSALMYNPTFWNQAVVKPRFTGFDTLLVFIFIAIVALTWINFSFVQTIAWSWLVLVISAVYLFRTIQRVGWKA
jgi:hypothetical protein